MNESTEASAVRTRRRTSREVDHRKLARRGARGPRRRGLADGEHDLAGGAALRDPQARGEVEKELPEKLPEELKEDHKERLRAELLQVLYVASVPARTIKVSP